MRIPSAGVSGFRWGGFPNFGKTGGEAIFEGGGPPPQKRPIKYCNNCPEISLKGNRYMSKNTCVSAVLTLFSQFRSFFTPMTPKLKSTIGGISPVPVSSSQTRPSSDPKTGTKWHFRATLLVIEKVSDRQPELYHPPPRMNTFHSDPRRDHHTRK